MEQPQLSFRASFCLVLVVVASVNESSNADERAPPPSLAFARFSPSEDQVEIGRYVVETTLDPVKDIPVTTRQLHYVGYRFKDVEFSDLSRKPIDAAAACKRLKTETPIILLQKTRK